MIFEMNIAMLITKLNPATEVALRITDFVISTIKEPNEQTQVRITASLSSEEKKQLLQYNPDLTFDTLGAKFTEPKAHNSSTQFSEKIQKLHRRLFEIKGPVI
jgi:hypothetical protein